MISYTWIDSPQALRQLNNSLIENKITTIAMDFEEESNLHVYGEHLCLIQVFDRNTYYAIDALKISSYLDGKDALKEFLESPVEKIMFDCSSDSSIARKTLGIQLANIFDLRVLALGLEFTGNLNSLIERNLSIRVNDQDLKHKYQRANWMKRPLSQEQLEYAMGDVTYLFDLKESLKQEVSALPISKQKQLSNAMKTCAVAKHSEKPGWMKICNYKALSKRQKVFIRHFFTARDNLARKANVPATNILEKQLIVQMAKQETWQGILDEHKMRYSGVFEQARRDAVEELRT